MWWKKRFLPLLEMTVPFPPHAGWAWARRGKGLLHHTGMKERLR
jgi:hypothetical protein